jgi:hypothetical protein
VFRVPPPPPPPVPAKANPLFSHTASSTHSASPFSSWLNSVWGDSSAPSATRPPRVFCRPSNASTAESILIFNLFFFSFVVLIFHEILFVTNDPLDMHTKKPTHLMNSNDNIDHLLTALAWRSMSRWACPFSSSLCCRK